MEIVEAYKTLRESLEKALLPKNSPKNLKEGDLMLIIQEMTEYKEGFIHIGIVKLPKTNSSEVRLEGSLTYNSYEGHNRYNNKTETHWRMTKYSFHEIYHTKTDKYYKIRKPERIQEMITEIEHCFNQMRLPHMDSQITLPHMEYDGQQELKNSSEKAVMALLKALIKEVQETPEHMLATMDQRLHAELAQMQPEKRLKTTKKLEKILEKKVKNTEHDNPNQMLATKKLYEYAQKCGVVSERAKMLYKEKRRELGKLVRKLELEEF